MIGHPTNMCSSLQESSMEQGNVIGGFPSQPNQRYNYFSNTYNEGWNDHPNLRYENQQQQNIPFQIPNRPPGFLQLNVQPPFQSP